MRVARFGAVAAAAMLALPALGGSASAEETKLLFNLFFPKQHSFPVGMFYPWAENVAKATNGRVKVEFSASSLAAPTRQFDMVSKGIADVAFSPVQVLGAARRAAPARRAALQQPGRRRRDQFGGAVAHL